MARRLSALSLWFSTSPSLFVYVVLFIYYLWDLLDMRYGFLCIQPFGWLTTNSLSLFSIFYGCCCFAWYSLLVFLSVVVAVLLFSAHTHWYTLQFVRHPHFLVRFLLLLPNFFQFGLMLFSQSSRRRQRRQRWRARRRQGNGMSGNERHLAPLALLLYEIRHVSPGLCMRICVWCAVVHCHFLVFSSALLAIKVVKRSQWDFECFDAANLFHSPRSRYFAIDHNIYNDSFRMGINTYINTDIWILPVSSELKMFPFIRCFAVFVMYFMDIFIEEERERPALYLCVSLSSMSLYLLIFGKYLAYMAYEQ